MRKYFEDEHWHRVIQLRFVKESADYVCLESDYPLHFQDKGEEKTFPYAAKAFFFFEKWYNIFVFYTQQNDIKSAYCNVATPPQFKDGQMSFIDLDLDVLVSRHFTIEILDEDEFLLHKNKYPIEIIRKAHSAVAEIQKLVQARQHPFDWH